MIRICKQCNKKFNFRACPTDLNSGRGKYCSNKCKNNSHITQPRFNICKICNISKPNLTGHIRKYCSRQCRYEDQKGVKPWNYGKVDVYSLKTRQLMAEKKFGTTVWNKGLPKELQPGWRGGIMKEAFLYSRIRLQRVKANGGKHSKAEWYLLKEKFKFTCPACRKKEPEIKLTKDHIIPVVLGGKNNITNIQPLCERCNKLKHTKIIIYEP